MILKTKLKKYNQTIKELCHPRSAPVKLCGLNGTTFNKNRSPNGNQLKPLIFRKFDEEEILLFSDTKAKLNNSKELCHLRSAPVKLCGINGTPFNKKRNLNDL